MIDEDMCTAVAWSSSNELYSVGDDKVVLNWNINGEPMPKVCDLEHHVTDIHWFPYHSKRLATSTTDILVAACDNGKWKCLLYNL